VYAYYLFDKEGETLPAEVTIGNFTVPSRTTITLLGTKGKLSYKNVYGSVVVKIPPSVAKQVKSKYAVCFKIQ
jgi:hypothetical protein